ncbi:MAG: glycosyltransferase family 2 protein [Candidatus Rokubacteria bacterium]|nr:glycosyltransferase family 2 protein [Candidatus Rokubacteria bacterium]
MSIAPQDHPAEGPEAGRASLAFVPLIGRHEDPSRASASGLYGAWNHMGKISIIIPAYNEESRVQKAIDEISTFLRSNKADFEILIVDDGSQDKTSSIVTGLQSQYEALLLIRLERNRGKGAAVKAGMLAATGEFLVFTDADQSTSIDQLPKLLLPLLGHNIAIAIGSRAAWGARVIQGQGWYRELLGKTFGWLSKMLLVRGYKDSQCGFKCFRRDAALKIFPHVTSDSVLFDLEALLLAALHHLKVAEVPVVWVHNRDSRIVYDVRRSIMTFRELLRIRRQWKVLRPLKVAFSSCQTKKTT